MVITLVEAEVTPEGEGTLRQKWVEITGGPLPPGLVESFLVKQAGGRPIWRILSVWQSREALEEMRRTTETPGAILMFRAAGVEPTLSILEVVGRAPGV